LVCIGAILPLISTSDLGTQAFFEQFVEGGILAEIQYDQPIFLEKIWKGCFELASM